MTLNRNKTYILTPTILFDCIRIDEKINNLEENQNVGCFYMTDVLVDNQFFVIPVAFNETLFE